MTKPNWLVWQGETVRISDTTSITPQIIDFSKLNNTEEDE